MHAICSREHPSTLQWQLWHHKDIYYFHHCLQPGAVAVVTPQRYLLLPPLSTTRCSGSCDTTKIFITSTTVYNQVQWQMWHQKDIYYFHHCLQPGAVAVVTPQRHLLLPPLSTTRCSDSCDTTKIFITSTTVYNQVQWTTAKWHQHN